MPQMMVNYRQVEPHFVGSIAAVERPCHPRANGCATVEDGDGLDKPARTVQHGPVNIQVGNGFEPRGEVLGQLLILDSRRARLCYSGWLGEVDNGVRSER